MRLSKWFSLPLMSAVLAVAAVSATNHSVHAADPTTKPADEKGSRASSGKWGVAPWNKLSNVSDDQKLKIMEIHRKSVAERKAIDDKEDADIMALLTPEQKEELDKLNADKKTKAAEKRQSKKDEKDDKDDSKK